MSQTPSIRPRERRFEEHLEHRVEGDALAEPSGRRRLSRLTVGQIALVVGVAVAVWALGSVLMLVFFAILLAASLRGAADLLAAHAPLSPRLALAVVVLGLALVLGALFYWTGPNLFAQLNDLTTRLVAEIERLRQLLQDRGLMQGSGQMQGIAERVVSPMAQVATFSLTTASEIVVAIVTAIYFAAAPSVYVGGVIRLAPIRHRARLRHVLGAVAHVLRMWVLGQLFNMVAIGLLATAGLWALGVPAPFALGLVSGLFTFVPYLGTIVSGLIAIALALSQGPGLALWTLGVFTLCHVFEGYIISPLVQRRMLELPPALSVMSMTVLGSLFGLPGVILGTPFAAAILVLAQSLYVGDVLGDREVDPTVSHP